jgi:hypothetical protein
MDVLVSLTHPASRPLPPGRFLGHISVRGWVDHRVIVRLEGLGKLKHSNDLIGNRTRYLPAFNIVPQPIMLPRGPIEPIVVHNILIQSVTECSFARVMQIIDVIYTYKILNQRRCWNSDYVTGWTTGDRGRFLGQEWDVSRLRVYLVCTAHPASYPTGTGDKTVEAWSWSLTCAWCHG